MRSAGILPTEEQARRFVDYLLTKNMGAKVESENGEFAIWIHEEDQLTQAREELAAFRAEPNHERYSSAGKQAESIRRDQAKQAEETRKRTTEMRQQWSRPATQKRPLTVAIILISIGVSVGGYFGQAENGVYETLLFVNKPEYARQMGAYQLQTGALPGPMSSDSLMLKLGNVKRGQVWRLVTPIFCHYGIFHIAFNMLWMWQLGGVLEQRMGTVRYGLLILVIALISTTLTAIMPYRLVLNWGEPSYPFIGGMSGVVYGLVGYLWAKSLIEPMSGFMLNPTIVMILLVWLVLGISGILDMMFSSSGRVSNWGHLWGLVIGFAIPYLEAVFGRRSG